MDCLRIGLPLHLFMFSFCFEIFLAYLAKKHEKKPQSTRAARHDLFVCASSLTEVSTPLIGIAYTRLS